MNTHFDLLENLDVQQYTTSRDRAKKIHAMAMIKAGPAARSGPPRRRSLLLAAAVAAAGIFAAAAGSFTASDAMRGYLRERGADGNPAGLETLSPIVDRTGQVLGQSAESGGIRITPRAVAGDDTTFTVLFDLENTSGGPLGVDQGDGTFSQEPLYLQDVTLSWSGMGDARAVGYTLESAVDGARGTILQRFTVNTPVPIGETVHMEFDRLLQVAEVQNDTSGDIGMGPQALYDAVSGYLSAAPDTPGADSGDDEAFVRQFLQEQDQALPLSGVMEGCSLTGAALRNGALYLRGAAPNVDIVYTNLRESALVGADGEVLWRSDLLRHDLPDGVTAFTIIFEGVGSLEDLQGTAWLSQYGKHMHPLTTGSWSFSFPLDYEIVGRYLDTNQTVMLSGRACTVTGVAVTPYKVQVDIAPGDVGQETLEKILAELSDTHGAFTLELADGSVRLDAPNAYMTYAEGTWDLESIRILKPLDSLIDPAQAVAVHVGGLRIELAGD